MLISFHRHCRHLLYLSRDRYHRPLDLDRLHHRCHFLFYPTPAHRRYRRLLLGLC